jgi:hypothetical protein
MLLVVVVAAFMAIGGFGIVYLAGAFDTLAREVDWRVKQRKSRKRQRRECASG